MSAQEIDCKKWSAGNVLYYPATDAIWIVYYMANGLALVDDGGDELAFVSVMPQSELECESENTILLGKL